MRDAVRIAMAVARLAATASLALAGCTATRPPGSELAMLGGGPRALVREPSHDFGTVEPGTLVTHRFEVANVGDQPLDILAVTTSCGCTASVASDRTVWPGQTGSIEVTLDTVLLAGKQSKAVRLRTSDPSVSELALTLYGEVVSDVAAEPRHVYLGRVAPGEVSAAVVNVRVLRPDVAITGVRSESGQLDVSVTPLDAPDQGMRLVVVPRTNGTPGRFSDRVVVTTTSSRQPRIVIPVLASLERGAPSRSASAPSGGGPTGMR